MTSSDTPGTGRANMEREPPRPVCLRLARPLLEVTVPLRYRDLYQRCAARVQHLDRDIGGIPSPFELETFVDRVAAYRGQPIVVRAGRHRSGRTCGLTTAVDGVDLIVHAPTTALHRAHIVTHELAHLISGHTAPEGAGPDTARLAPELHGRALSMLGRSAYSAEQEQEAEMIASLIMEGARRDTTPRAAGPDPTTVARIETAFGA